jgi:TrpR-related protein YerC/YecD
MKTHRTLTPRQEALAERHLCTAVASLQSSDECRAFFRDLCTPAELQAMADRWAVVEWLRRGLPYREIHRLSGVSVTTIGRVARCLGKGTGGYATAVRRLEAARHSQEPTEAASGLAVQEGTKRPQGSRRPEATRHG